jgi:hypothetical protein
MESQISQLKSQIEMSSSSAEERQDAIRNQIEEAKKVLTSVIMTLFTPSGERTTETRIREASWWFGEGKRRNGQRKRQPKEAT